MTFAPLNRLSAKKRKSSPILMSSLYSRLKSERNLRRQIGFMSVKEAFEKLKMSSARNTSKSDLLLCLRKFEIGRFELRLCDRIPHHQIVGDQVGRCRTGDFRQALKPPRLPGVVGVKQGDPVRFRLA